MQIKLEAYQEVDRSDIPIDDNNNARGLLIVDPNKILFFNLSNEKLRHRALFIPQPIAGFRIHLQTAFDPIIQRIHN